MNVFTTPAQLRPIASLLRSREQYIVPLIYELLYEEIANDGQFESKRSDIKNVVLIEPIVFVGTSVLIKNRQSLTVDQQTERETNCFDYLFSYSFTGCKELFAYGPETFCYRRSDRGVMQPVDNRICLSIRQNAFDYGCAFTEAQILLGLTMQCIASNNAVVREWSTRTEQRIDYELQKKREELLKIRGSNP